MVLKRDLATFKRLPEETKELLKLKDQDERTTGTDQLRITRKIEEKARKSRP